ncbi:hypothetical protein F4X86_02880 [Candidatus Saccharibacteria bacterium]|nr:hypothetical protein [Candidatus Saccharibacteria bacterium]
MKRLVDNQAFRLLITALLALLGLALALGWVNTSSAYENPLEGEIEISFKVKNDRPVVRIVAEGDHIGIKYYRGNIVDGEETICHPVGQAIFDLVPATDYDDNGKKIFLQHDKSDRDFYLHNDNYDYVCLMVVWGTWDENGGVSYGPYRMGSDVTADNFDDLLQIDEPATETPPVETPSFSLIISQRQLSDSNYVRATATLSSGSTVTIDSWEYLVADTETVTIDSDDDCQALFDDGSASGILVSKQAMTAQTASAYADVPAEHDEEWICIRAVDEDDDAVIVFVRLIEYIETSQNGQSDTQTQDDNSQTETLASTNRQTNNSGETNVGNNNDDGSQGGVNDPPNTGSVEPELTSAGVQDTTLNSASDNTEGIPDTGLVDDGQWWQLVGFVMLSVAVLASVKIMVAKKRHNGA